MVSLAEAQRDLAADLTPLEARVLVAAACELSQAQLILQHDTPLSLSQTRKLKHWQALRQAGMPLSRILKRREFYGLEFYLAERVLDPRPDSEVLVENALALYQNKTARFLDWGTGTGCLAISILHNAPHLSAVGIDISRAALRCARINAERLGVRDRFSIKQAPAQHNEVYDFIIANPPYIRRDEIEKLQVEVREHDPRRALDGGKEGLSCYRKVIDDAQKLLRTGGHLLLELGEPQAVARLLQAAGFSDIQQKPDLAGKPRVLIAKK